MPEQIPFITYPYEWSFDQLRDAALLTLEVQSRALAHGLTLKDASAYNVQFRGATPVFIDTLSFERDSGGPWRAYEQFCRHFLGPLLLMRFGLADAARYLKADLDGFDVGSVSRLLPMRSYLKPGVVLHIHLHGRAARAQTSADVPRPGGRVAVGRIVASLRRTIERLPAPRFGGEWSDYYAERRFYPPGALESKRKAVRELTGEVRPGLVFDLGANTGLFAREAADLGALCIALEGDPACVNRLYLEERGQPQQRILPLVMDLANPSPALGFDLRSTMSLFDRPRADLVLCLALLHHLRVRGNLPFTLIAAFLARLGRWALVEYVPFTDPAVRTLTSRVNDFADYTLPGFFDAFLGSYHLRATRPIQGTDRVLYLFEARSCAT
ncbi:MAG: SAM-dependent methyltransferase [Bryobacteraceae bacterium]